jgi:broad specificity phosphatase PhoE
VAVSTPSTGAVWPASLLLVRHGESAGNVATEVAEREHLHDIDISTRDMDTPLSERGAEQAEALGAVLAQAPHPDVVLSSPYVRAGETARIALTAASIESEIVLDERLREREFGLLDRLTRDGILARYPEQAEARAFLGKFYYRPPGGESWADVLLRLRSLMDSVTREHAGRNVLVVTHQVVILMFRYMLEHMTEAEVLKIDHQNRVANCSVTEYRLDAQGKMLKLVRFNDSSHIRVTGAEVTAAPDIQQGPR